MGHEANLVIVPLAPGFEEIEAVTVIDVLRRADLEVIIAGLDAGPATGSHGITVSTDCAIDAVDPARCLAVVLPGGMPGAERLRDDARVQRLLADVRARGHLVAAICAAPMALVPAGVSTGRTLTSFPGFGAHLVDALTYVEDRVVIDDRVITSRGPGTALEFALTLVEFLVSPEKAQALESAMLVQRASPPLRVS